MTSKLTHLSLCTGIGGLDLAAEYAGFDTSAQCEIDPYASEVLKKNFKGVHNFGDIRTITARTAREHGIDPGVLTVVSAGFPCQPYSIAGKGQGDGDSRDLWDEVARVTRELRPRWFVGENTPGLFSRSNQRFFHRILDNLDQMGYNVSWGIWGAYNVGAPHKRDRIFIVGNNDRQEQKVPRKEPNPYHCGICREIPYSARIRCYSNPLQQRDPQEGIRQENIRREGCRNQPSRICSGSADIDILDTISKRHRASQEEICSRRNSPFRSSWWKTEPNVGRVANGIPSRVDRLRCLGNAVLPMQAYPIFACIAEIERGE